MGKLKSLAALDQSGDANEKQRVVEFFENGFWKEIKARRNSSITVSAVPKGAISDQGSMRC